MGKWGEVLKQTPYRKLGATGEVEDWWRITARTKKGTTFNIDYPDKDMTPEKVEPVLETKAAELDKIMGL